MADFNLGRIRFVWQGQWQPAVAYVRDDVVYEAGSSYVCIDAHTSGSSFSDNADKFELMAERGETSPTTTKGDIIFRGDQGDERLPIGTSGQALFVDSNGIPEWSDFSETESTFFVTTTGNNSNDGVSVQNPFLTISHAVSQVSGTANIFVKSGTFYEQLPIDVPQGVAITGDGQRTTEIKPVNISNAGATVAATDGADTSTTIQIQDSQDVGEEWQVGARVTGTSISGTVTITDISADTPIAGFTTLTVSFSSQTVSEETVTLVSDYSEETMFRMGDSSMLHKVLMNGLTGFEPDLSNPTDITAATVKGVYVALDPNSPILNKSPYVLECSSFSTGGVGAVVDGTVHSSGNRSIVFHAYTNIHSDGVGYWVNGEGKTEIVSCFTYYCWFGYTTTNGGKIRSLSGNNSYGTYGVVSGGFNANETPITGTIKGEQLEILSVSGTFGIGNTITGGTSGATGEVLNVQSDKIYYLAQSGTFTAGETVTDGTSGATAEIATGGVTGQKGFLLIVDGLTAEPAPGSSVSIAGDSLAYIVQNVSGTYSNTSSVLNILLANEKVTPSSDGTSISIRKEYSQARLTGHDFLSIGTGSKSDTNYPSEFTQSPSQANEVVEDLPGRVFYVSTDQDGNFRVGDYFKVDQATGRATLNASAFDLSGLTSLRLGAIGAQLGELVEEFSSDATLSGNSNSAVPTEAATRAYFTQVATDIVPNTDNALTLGTSTNRWQEVFVGPGSVQIGTVKLSEVGGNFSVSTEAGLPSTLEADTFDTGSITLTQNNISGTNSNEDIEVAASGTGVVRFNSAVEIATDRLYGPSTFIIDPATHDDNTGTLIVAGNLQVDGTTTTINSTTLEVDDKNVVLAKGAADATAADGAGITIDGAAATILYDAADDNFKFNKSINITGEIINGVTVGLGSGSVFTNTAVGVEVLRDNTSGGRNTGYGFQTLRSNTTGVFNTGYGFQALRANNGNLNTATGFLALYDNTSGDSNTAIGAGSGQNITTGSKNTIIGRFDGNQNGLDISASNNYIVLSDGDGNPQAYADNNGDWTFANGLAVDTDTLFVDSANNRVGIGTSSPASALDVNGDITVEGALSVTGTTQVEDIKEKVVVDTSASGTVDVDLNAQGVIFFTNNQSANRTVNFRGDGVTTVDSYLDTGQSVTVALAFTQGTTAYYVSSVQIDGATVTPVWQGGAAPAEGNADSVDVYSFTVIKTGAGLFTVLAAQTQFA